VSSCASGMTFIEIKSLLSALNPFYHRQLGGGEGTCRGQVLGTGPVFGFWFLVNGFPSSGTLRLAPDPNWNPNPGRRQFVIATDKAASSEYRHE